MSLVVLIAELVWGYYLLFACHRTKSGVLFWIVFGVTLLLTMKPVIRFVKGYVKHWLLRIALPVLLLIAPMIVTSVQGWGPVYYCDECQTLSLTKHHHKAEMIGFKPIIYLYPEEKTTVSVTVGYPEKFTHTYPKYGNGWQVVAEPNGDLRDASGRGYYALYWEGKITETYNQNDGFLVAGADTISFLEEKLAQLGLTDREANEFIVYWLPKLETNAYNHIRFLTMAEIEANMPLTITPKPNTVIRVMMAYKPATGTEQIVPQQLSEPPVRSGFVVVEWGGTQMPEQGSFNDNE